MADTTHVWLGTTSADWATANNWSPSGPPAAADAAAIIDGSAGSSISGFDASATTLDVLRIKASNTYAVGDNATPLKVGATAVYIHEPSQGTVAGSGAGRINLNISSTVTDIYILGSASSTTDSGKEPIRIQGGGTTASAFISGPARVGFATNTPADTMTLRLLEVTSSGANVTLGEGVTWTEIQQTNGNTTVNTSGQTIGCYGGTLYLNNGATANELTVGGKVVISERAVSGSVTFGVLTTLPGSELVINNAISVTTWNRHPTSKVTFTKGMNSHITATTENLINCSSETVG